MPFFKRIPLKILIPSAVCVLALLVSLFSFLSVSADKGTLPAQDAAARWRGESDERFTQVSVFLPESAAFTPEKVYDFRAALEARFLSESIEAEEGASLYKDAFAALCGAMTAKGDYGSSPVEVYALGGDWFFFHPLPLASGGYIRDDELMHDRVVLDTVAAWQLFGATDVAGRTVVIGDADYIVAGVVEREADRYSEKADDGSARLYAYADAPTGLIQDKPVACYEIVLPDPVSGFGRKLMEDVFPKTGGELVENSTRYDIPALWEVLKSFSSRTIRKNDVTYPYWENAARLSENHAARLLPFWLVPPLLPLAFLVTLGVVFANKGVKKVAEKIKRYREFG